MLRLAQLQTHVFEEKMKNISVLAEKLEQLSREGVDMVTLPEMFCCPYETAAFPRYAEPEGGEAWSACAALAREYGIYLAAGTMPERGADGRIYNTAYVFDRGGKQIAKHRKMHLFDIDVAGGQRFRESDTLTAGEDVTVFETEFGILGTCVCFDIRFPELSRLMVQRGARLILIPAAFNLTTGPAHWEMTFRARAVDNQVFTIGTAPARDMDASYHSWAHSIVVDPWGTVLSDAGEDEGCIITTLDLARCDEIRKQLPLLSALRSDIYQLSEVAI